MKKAEEKSLAKFRDGTVHIPKQIANSLNIKDGDYLEAYKESGRIILKKYRRGCTLCGNVNSGRVVVLMLDERHIICEKCVNLIQEEIGKQWVSK